MDLQGVVRHSNFLCILKSEVTNFSTTGPVFESVNRAELHLTFCQAISAAAGDSVSSIQASRVATGPALPWLDITSYVDASVHKTGALA